MIKLTALEPEDLELLYTIENDPEQWSVSNANTPYSRYGLRNYIGGQQFDIYADKQVRFVVRVSENEEHDKGTVMRGWRAVGLIDLFNFSPEHLRAEMGLAILRSERGKGYATEAICQLQRYCREVLHMYQIYCVVPASNVSSLAMLRKSGFSNEVVLKKWLKTVNGREDAIMTFYTFID